MKQCKSSCPAKCSDHQLNHPSRHSADAVAPSRVRFQSLEIASFSIWQPFRGCSGVCLKIHREFYREAVDTRASLSPFRDFLPPPPSLPPLLSLSLSLSLSLFRARVHDWGVVLPSASLHTPFSRTERMFNYARVRARV